jgi:hypothetical protein
MLEHREQACPARPYVVARRAKMPGAKTDKDRNFYERKCEHLDKQIDALVYELYGLTAEEIGIVEGRTEKKG